jgi:hypothetical protein
MNSRPNVDVPHRQAAMILDVFADSGSRHRRSNALH